MHVAGVTPKLKAWARFGAILLLTGSTLLAQGSYNWKSVTVSGAGAMVTGVYAHPLQSGLVYIRTDVGGSYRWNAATSRWIALNDSLAFGQSGYFCCEGFAIDPNDTNTIYYAGGNNNISATGAIFKSTDQGSNWTQLNGPSVEMDGNGDQRWGDCRLVVSPSNSSVILFGSRNNGLWRSADAGATWTNITALQAGKAGYGVQCLAYDPASPGLVYAGVHSYAVYKSTDDGLTWSSIGGSSGVMHMKVGPDHKVWCTTSTGTNSTVSKYSNGAWTNYTPAGAASYCALAVNPSNANDVIVAREFTNGSNSIIYRTLNSGTTWTQMAYTVASTATWAVPGRSNYRPCDFAFDPFNTTTVWGDRWRTTDLNGVATSGTVAWIEQEIGHEEDVCGAIAAPPSGYELINGVFDDDGFAMNNGLDAFPSKQLGTTSGYNGHTWSLAYSENAPSTLIRLGFQSFYGGTISPVIKSTDGGVTWIRQTNFPVNLFPLACAVSATNANNYVVVCDANYSSSTSTWTPVAASNPWRYTTDGGTTWSVIGGLPTPPGFSGPWGNNQFLSADHVNGSKFYYFDVASNSTSTGKIYGSVDSGATFTQVNTPAGQYSIGVFLASGSTQTFTTTADPGSQVNINFLNAVSVRQISSSATNTQIIWGPAKYIYDDSDVSTSGSYFDAALAQQGVDAGNALAVNGVTFNVIANGNIASDASGKITLTSSRNPYTTGLNSPNGSAAYNTLVSQSEYANANSSQTITLKKLTPGQVYQVQVWSVAGTVVGSSTGNFITDLNGANTVALNSCALLPPKKAWYILKTRPGAEGDVWACLDNYPSATRTSDEGLYHSSDSGVSWIKVPTVNRAFSFGFGASGTSIPYLYVYGRILNGASDALYVSADLGNTWTNITSADNKFGDYPSLIEGSRQTVGRVFVGTGGRGFFYGTPRPDAPSGVAALSGTGLGQISLAWNPVSGGQTYLIQRSATSGASGFSSLTTVAAPGTSYVDSNLAAGQTYFYQIATVTSTGTSDYSALASAIPYVPPTYSGWVYSYFGPNPTGAQASDSANPACDGIANLMKYGLGLNPTIAYSGTSRPLPQIGTIASGSNRYLTLTFSGAATDVTYTVEATSELGAPWSSIYASSPGVAPGIITASDTVPVSAASRRFLRLKITRP